MAARELAEIAERQPYFEAASVFSPEENEGTREIGPLYPFLISGGTNTERYYFTHINDTTDYHFNIFPKYFGNEASYTDVFPERIKDIIKKNAGAKIFCVFDWDTVFFNKTNQKKHEAFEKCIKEEIDNGTVVLCPTMPSIEYWFLLHFVDYTGLIKSCGTKMQKLLSPHMKSYFPTTNKKLLNLLKDKKYIANQNWVIELCKDGKLDAAIKRAEANIKAAEAADDLNSHSYSYIYKVFTINNQNHQ